MHTELLIKRLRDEHYLVKQILSKMLQSHVDSRKTLFEELKLNLLPHLEAEEKEFYPVLEKQQEAHQESLEALEEHHVAKIVFEELQQSDFKTDDWLAKCKVLKDLLYHHIEEEETEIFELAKKLITEKQIVEIYNNFLDQENLFKGRLAA